MNGRKIYVFDWYGWSPHAEAQGRLVGGFQNFWPQPDLAGFKGYSQENANLLAKTPRNFLARVAKCKVELMWLTSLCRGHVKVSWLERDCQGPSRWGGDGWVSLAIRVSAQFNWSPLWMGPGWSCQKRTMKPDGSSFQKRLISHTSCMIQLNTEPGPSTSI